jgi:hypothetical protein
MARAAYDKTISPVPGGTMHRAIRLTLPPPALSRYRSPRRRKPFPTTRQVLLPCRPGRQRRRRHARHRRFDVQGFRRAGGRREQAGRRWRGRHRSGAESASRRLHDHARELVALDEPVLLKSLPYDTLKDTIALDYVGYIPLVLVTPPSSPYTSVQQVIAAAKAAPGTIAFASGGVGSGGHLAGELLKYIAQVDMIHVPYQGNAPSLTSVLGGHNPLMFDTLANSLPHIQAGKLRVLAITSLKRSPLLPNVPRWWNPASPISRSAPGSRSSASRARRPTSSPS